MRIVYLTTIGNNWYDIENGYGESVTRNPQYFSTIEDAVDWAKRWASSWEDVFIDIQEVYEKETTEK